MTTSYSVHDLAYNIQRTINTIEETMKATKDYIAILEQEKQRKVTAEAAKKWAKEYISTVKSN